MRLLDERGIQAGDVGVRRPSLDEVFLAVTGKPLGDTDPDRESPREGGRLPQEAGR